MPDGSVPKFGGQDGFNQFIDNLTITPEKYDSSKRIAQSDMKAYIDASASLLALRIDSVGDFLESVFNTDRFI